MDNLSKNAIIDISNGKTTTKPLLQIIHIQNMTKRGSASAERYIIILSDGRHHMEGVCTNNLGLAIKTGRIKNFAIVRLDEFRVNTAKNGKKVIVALKGELVNGAIGSEIGSSVSYADYSPDAETRKHKPTEAPKTEPKKFKPLNGDPNVLSDLEQSIVPLESLNPYRGKWAVRVRCTAVSPVRMWQKPTGSGKVMSVDLLDESGTEIRATMFNEAVDRFGDVFAEDKVYVIARGRVKLANKKFTHIRNDYEITLDAESVVQVVVDDRRIGKENYNFSALRDLESADENSFVDVLAVVSRIDPVASIMSVKQNKYVEKRNVLLTDKTASVELTLWSEAAAKFDEEALKDNPVVSIKAARVSHFGGRSLSLSGSSKMVVNPDLQDVYRLKSWYLSEGKNASVPVLSGNSGASVAAITDSDKVIDLCEVSDRQLGSDQNGAGDVFVVKATIMSIRHDFAKPPFYFACSKARDGRTCNKKASKVDSAGSEEFWCEMCNSVTEARARYILNFSLNDHTGSQFVNCFDEVGEKILGVAAGDLSKLAEGPLADEAAFGDVFLKAAFQTKLYKIKAKSENYLDEERIRCTVLAVQDIDFVNQSVKLLEKLNLMS